MGGRGGGWRGRRELAQQCIYPPVESPAHKRIAAAMLSFRAGLAGHYPPILSALPRPAHHSHTCTGHSMHRTRGRGQGSEVLGLGMGARARVGAEGEADVGAEAGAIHTTTIQSLHFFIYPILAPSLSCLFPLYLVGPTTSGSDQSNQ